MVIARNSTCESNAPIHGDVINGDLVEKMLNGTDQNPVNITQNNGHCSDNEKGSTSSSLILFLFFSLVIAYFVYKNRGKVLQLQRRPRSRVEYRRLEDEDSCSLLPNERQVIY
ncbi:unnamed protein product, partial [Mesorhabditis belari]|uniref:Uncharacterized protein n=1 Tax=Mesorhabditis belari TaxID=2138241 RepID=A0AAF3ELZ7_9BILA